MNKKRINEMVAEITAAKSIYHLGGSIECSFSSIGNKEDIPLITNYMQELNCSRSYVQHDSMEYLMFFIDKGKDGKLKWGIYTLKGMEV